MAAKRATKTKAVKKVSTAKGKATKAPAKVRVKVKKSAPLKKKKTIISKDKQTRAQILNQLSEVTNLSKVQVESVFEELNKLIASHMHPRGSGEFTIPMSGIKIRRVRKKATKARNMVSPLTGQEVTIASKPARNVIKLSALKVLKDTVEK